ncbi:MAG: hypothetical protein HUU08_09880 [Candidatus Brocadia sp.]|nr:hypothetical protein [Candidatus Brocadia sp.]
MSISTIYRDYITLSFIDLHASKVFSSREMTKTAASPESIMQDMEDAKKTLKLAGIWVNFTSESIINADEKYMVEMRSDDTRVSPSQNTDVRVSGKGIRKPHYSHLLSFDNTLIFQAACCLPLKIVAGSLDSNQVSGRVLFESHSEEQGGKLVYQFKDKGTELIIDIQRRESPRAQRYIFRGM